MYIGNKKILDIRTGSRRITRIYDGSRIIYDSISSSMYFVPDRISFVPTDLRSQNSSIFTDPDQDWNIEIKDN